MEKDSRQNATAMQIPLT